MSADKYPAYKDYQKRVGMFLPVDTALRSIYYTFMASKEQKARIEQNIWGTSTKTKVL